MQTSRRTVRFLIVAVCTATLGPAAPVHAAPAPVDAALTRHVLARTTYGPTAADAKRVRELGVAGWIDEQLDPARLDDAALAPRLARYAALRASPDTLHQLYPEGKQVGKKAAAMQMEGGDMPDRPARRMQGEAKPRLILEQLAAARLLRATYSRRQLEEIMVGFWFNHFNVFWGKGACKWLVPSFEADAIRPHALGRFRDLLGATAHHPAMLYYLDNHLSVAPRPGKKGGLNENYARELLELHTLGVDAGYTQQDVIEVARCFTGWSIDQPKAAASFVFRRNRHDGGDKIVLGLTICGNRKTPSEGDQVLDLLATHPGTARFIATKLCRRFIADVPPAAAVAHVADAFSRTGGDIRETLRTLFACREFTAGEFRGVKVKSPVEYLVSALRALEAEAGVPRQMLNGLREMGEPPYACEPPTGYPDTAAPWISAGALLGRMRTAEALASGRSPLVRVDLEHVAGCPLDVETTLVTDRLWDRLVGVPMSDETRRVLAAANGDSEVRRAVLDDTPHAPDYPKVVALILGSPEFQRR